MIENSTDTLTEGIEYLRGNDSTYNPNKDEYRYTLDFILKSIDKFDLIEAENKIVKMMIFDALIGNSDRHQENWGFITLYQNKFEELEKKINTEKYYIKRIIPKFQKGLIKIIHQLRKIEEVNENGINKTTLKNQSTFASSKFSLIYDSGCCLGRELEDQKIINMTFDNQMLKAYASKGLSEIRFVNGKKPKHFDVLLIIQEKYPQLFKSIQDRITINFNQEKLDFLIQNIDSQLPENLKSLKLPDIRKKFIIKLISLRVEKIVSI